MFVCLLTKSYCCIRNYRDKTCELDMNICRLIHLLLFFPPKEVDKYDHGSEMCVRVHACVLVRKVCYGWGRAATGAETVRHSVASKRGRHDTKVSV